MNADETTVRRLIHGDFEEEFDRTRALLERMPDEHWVWTPHEKSFGLGALGAHLANLLVWQKITIEEDGFDLAQVPPEREVPVDRAALLHQWDHTVPQILDAIATLTLDDLHRDWTLRHGDRVMFTRPRGLVLRTFGITHMAHHRGQLSVYLRMLGVPLPAIYGPTADQQAGP